MDHSETKYLPKVDHTPAELDDASRLLLKTAEVIERQGWCQNYIGTHNGRVCMEGALMVAYGSYPGALISSRTPVALEALKRLNKAVRCEVYRWNDADGRTADEVISKLRAVALGL